MGKAKPVTISGKLFKTQADAISYFKEHKDVLLSGDMIHEGELYESLKDVYLKYCNNSPGYELNGRVITGFSVGFEKRNNNGVWASHPCYKVHFSNDEVRPFSINKAVKSASENV
ncbi:hypothetical protein [Salinivibrio proteolyticus]|uniref:hypothetical protein n=1 Tax=Salinivibrio proteolyticus TaxID=334715 RepID=UPI000988F45B|nr:hypothetical protein [Salinivibrio proteolyticus]OOF28592.1 hypothetical protein BZJ20_15890 [Salinivibrio proteolyticus]